MLPVYIDGWLMNKKERRDFLLMSCIAGVSLVGFALFLWHIALISQPKEQRAAIIAALLFTYMVFFILHSVYEMSLFVCSKYICDRHCVAIYYRSGKYVFDLAESFYISKVFIRVNRGRASGKLAFYLFSTTPICNIEPENIDIKRVPNLLSSNAVILPCDESVDLWLSETVCISSVPAFPKVAYKPHNC